MTSPLLKKMTIAERLQNLQQGFTKVAPRSLIKISRSQSSEHAQGTTICLPTLMGRGGGGGLGGRHKMFQKDLAKTVGGVAFIKFCDGQSDGCTGKLQFVS